MCIRLPQSKLGTCEEISQLFSTLISAVRGYDSGVRNRCCGHACRQRSQHKPRRLRVNERLFRAGNPSDGGRCVSCSRHLGAKAPHISAGRCNGWRELTSENPGRRKGDSPGRPVDRRDLQSSEARPSVILVVDDDALFRKLITFIMRQDGHFVLSAANGHEGLELSRQYLGSIDLVITDVEMPRLNGTDLCARSARRAARNQGVGDVRCSHERNRQPKCRSAVSAQAIRPRGPQSESSGDLGRSSSAADAFASLRHQIVILIADDEGVREEPDFYQYR